jgi:SnoaL-like domain
MATADHVEYDRWLDDARIIRVVDSYFRALDEKRFDELHFRQFLSSEARVIRPNGAATVGLADIVDSHAHSFTRFEATQHLLTGHDVDIEDDAAAVRANLIAIHIWNDRPGDASMFERSFTAGGVITADLRRVPTGWHITELQNRVVWRTGFFGNMAQTQ